MLVLVGAGAAVGVGLAVGGRLAALAEVPLRWAWVGLAAFLLQLYVVYARELTPDLAGAVLLVGSHLALILVAAANARGRLRLPFALLALGAALNGAVMAANGGWMPISPETLVAAGRTEAWKVGDMRPGTRVAHSKDVLLAAAETRLEPLADRFRTGLPGRLNVVFSAGDVLLVLGAAGFVVRAMTPPPPRVAGP
jgi:hypothetical protein